MPLSCRFYEKEYPEENEVVVAMVTSITNSGSYVVLPEYDNAIGMILHSELSRRRIRSINKLVRVGRSDIVLVIRVDPDKGYIDLSKRRVPLDETSVCQERFAKAKAVNQIVRHAAEKLGYTDKLQLEKLCEKTVWYFDRKYANEGGSYEAFKRAVQNPSVLDACDIDEATKEMLLHNIRHRLMPQAVKLRADFEVSCFAYEGIDAVRRALRAGLELSTEELPIKINLIAPPLYVLTTQTLEWNEGLVKLEKVLEVIKESIESQEGSFKIAQKPRVVSETEEADFQRQLEDLEDANKEVSGDEDDEDEDEVSEVVEEEEEEKEEALEVEDAASNRGDEVAAAAADDEESETAEQPAAPAVDTTNEPEPAPSTTVPVEEEEAAAPPPVEEVGIVEWEEEQVNVAESAKKKKRRGKKKAAQ